LAKRNSPPADTRARSVGGVAPLTRKVAVGSNWKAAVNTGSLTQSCAHATFARNVRRVVELSTTARSKRAPSSLRVSVGVRPAKAKPKPAPVKSVANRYPLISKSRQLTSKIRRRLKPLRILKFVKSIKFKRR